MMYLLSYVMQVARLFLTLPEILLRGYFFDGGRSGGRDRGPNLVYTASQLRCRHWVDSASRFARPVKTMKKLRILLPKTLLATVLYARSLKALLVCESCRLAISCLWFIFSSLSLIINHSAVDSEAIGC